MSIQLRNLTIRYGDRTAVDDVSVDFRAGASGLLGRNGAGKSSILRALLGLVPAASGGVSFGGLPDGADGAAIRAHVGYMPERDAHLPQQTGVGLVSLLGMLSGMPRREALRRAHEVLYLVGLEEQRYREVAGYSTGMRQKAKLAAALVHDPAILLLDEPTNGLDPSGRADMLGLVRQLCRDLGKTVVLSTHIMQDVEAVCDEVVVLDAGRVVAQGPLQDLVGGGSVAYALDVLPRSRAIEAALASIGRVDSDARGNWCFQPAPGIGVQDIFACAVQAGAVVRSLVPVRRSLEDVFLQAIDSGRGGPSTAKPGEASHG